MAVTAESLFDDPTITAVYAQWINPHGDLLIDYVVINYSPEDNTMGDVSQSMDYLDPVRDGYEFLGWYNKDGNRVTEITLGEMGDLELFAQWAKAASVTVLPQTGNGSQFAGLLAVILGGALALLSTRTRTKRR